VVLDNLPAQKVADILEAIVERRIQIFYLPPYSPRHEPHQDGLLQAPGAPAAPARTIEALVERIGSLLDRFVPHECANFFEAAGYQRSS